MLWGVECGCCRRGFEGGCYVVECVCVCVGDWFDFRGGIGVGLFLVWVELMYLVVGMVFGLLFV